MDVCRFLNDDVFANADAATLAEICHAENFTRAA